MPESPVLNPPMDALLEQLTVGETMPIAAEPASIVIFGGAGDLAHRKLLPALYNLHLDGLLPPHTAIVGTGRKAMTDDEYRDFARDGIKQFSRRPLDDRAWETFAPSLFFVLVAIDEDATLATLGSRLDVIEHERERSEERV